ncbi:MAG: hypothetical protein WD066_07600 [Planctomycetaceae bacterium]
MNEIPIGTKHRLPVCMRVLWGCAIVLIALCIVHWGVEYIVRDSAARRLNIIATRSISHDDSRARYRVWRLPTWILRGYMSEGYPLEVRFVAAEALSQREQHAAESREALIEVELINRRSGEPLAAQPSNALNSLAEREAHHEARYPVRGSVIVDGQPAVGALVGFCRRTGHEIDTNHLFGFAEVRSDGSFEAQMGYKMPGIPSGIYSLVVSWPVSANPAAADRLHGKYGDPVALWHVIEVDDSPVDVGTIELSLEVRPEHSAGRQPPIER